MSNIKPLTDDISFENTHGEVPFILIYATVISRLTLFNDLNYAHYYSYFFDHPEVIPKKLMTAIDNANINDLFDDEKIFDALGLRTGIYKDIPYYTINGHKYIDFLKMQIPQKVNKFTNAYTNKLNDFARENGLNEILDLTKGDIYETSGQYLNDTKKIIDSNSVRQEKEYNNNIKLISIAASNYSGIYILADKRTPHTIWVSFRCSYSFKSVGIYFTPRTLIPYEPCKSDDPNESNKEAYVKGMFKVVANNIYAIIQAMTYLARDFLGHTEPNKVKVCTTGHSLGGALSTIFAYLFLNAMRTFDENGYRPELYNIFIRKVCCISFGAPRCMNSVVSRRFCYEVSEGNIVYKRLANQNDSVVNMPAKLFYYRHPCTDTNSINSGYKRNELLRCNETTYTHKLYEPTDYEKEYPHYFSVIHYEKPLECVSYHREAGTGNAHMIYFYIVFDIREGEDIYDRRGNLKLCRIGNYTEETKQSKFCFYNANTTMTESEKTKRIFTDNKITYELLRDSLINDTDGKKYSYTYTINNKNLKKPYLIPYTYNEDKSNLFDENIADPNPEMPNVICVPAARYAHLDRIIFINY